MEAELHNLERLLRRVQRYLDLSGEVVQAIGSSNEDQFRHRLMLARQQRDAVADADRALHQSPPADPKIVNLLEQLGKRRSQIATNEELIMAWLQTWRAPEAELLRSDGGVARWVDLLLPLEWNPQLDLAILLGNGWHSVAHELHRRGQQRLFILDPRIETPPGYPSRAIVASNFADLRDNICSSLYGPKPGQFVVHRFAEPGLTDEEQKLRQLAEELVLGRHHFNFGTLMRLGDRWVEQTLTNLPSIANTPSLGRLKDAFSKRPAIIISPGPSLKKNIHLLSGLRDRALLLSSVQTLRPLKEAGVVPHLSLVVDAAPIDWFLSGLSPAQIGRLGLAMHVDPSLFALPVPKFTFAGNVDPSGWLAEIFEDRIALRSGGSVSCAAFSLALFFGCDPIILLGQDLSFENGQVYIESSAKGRSKATFGDDGSVNFQHHDLPDEVRRIARPMMQQQTMELAGYYGGKVRTSADFSLFHTWFEAASRSDGGRRRLYNCTEGGAFIAGMEHLALAEVAATHLRDSFDADAIFHRVDGNLTKRHEQMNSWKREKREQLQVVQKRASECLGLIGRSRAGDAGALAALAAAEASLSRELQGLPFLSMLKQADLYAALEGSRIATTLEESLDAANLLYTHVLEAANRVAPLLQADT